jgi:Protein of unknown function (DUF3990)
MAKWKNDALVLFHGCTELSIRPSSPRGIAIDANPHNLSLVAGGHRTEFGRGFYATTWQRQAEFWANRQAKKLSIKLRNQPRPKAVVLRFEVARDMLAGLESLVFTSEHSGFWSFVAYCRSGSVSHGRGGGQTEYDVIYGPVSVWPQRLVIKDCDQISFHTDKALAAISTLSVASIGTPYF